MSEIQLRPVKSHLLAADGYDPARKLLHIRFAPHADGREGALYEYANFDQETFLAFDGAESKGSFFTNHIKNQPHRYPYRRVDAVTVLEALSNIGKYRDREKLIAYMDRLPDEVKRDDRVPKAFKQRLDHLKAPAT